MINTTCAGVNKCGNIRTCQRCAHNRQKKLADTAEAMERQHGQLTMTVLVPEKNTQAEIQRLRASFLRRAIAPAGIWTIETGTQFAGLHLNILSPKPAPARWRECATYSELVRTTSREAAAYIAKQSGMPPVEQYAGKLCGSFGQIMEFTATRAAGPVIHAASIEVMLGGGKIEMPEEKIFSREQDWDRLDTSRPTFYNPAFPHECNPPLKQAQSTPEKRREAMRRHLPNLYAAINKEPKQQQQQQQIPASLPTPSPALPRVGRE